MSPARTLLNTKYDLGDNRTHDTSFVGYIALYPLSRKETAHSSTSYFIGQALGGGHERSIVGEQFRGQFGNDANLEILSLVYSFKFYICQDPRIARAYTAQKKKNALLVFSFRSESIPVHVEVRNGYGRARGV